MCLCPRWLQRMCPFLLPPHNVLGHSKKPHHGCCRGDGQPNTAAEQLIVALVSVLLLLLYCGKHTSDQLIGLVTSIILEHSHCRAAKWFCYFSSTDHIPAQRTLLL